MEFFIAAALLGLIPAAIAKNKGRDFVIWWLYGALLFIVALIHALVMPSESKPTFLSNNEPLRDCPYCAEPIRFQATKCKHCGSDVESARLPEPKYNGTQIAWDRLFYVIVAIVIVSIVFGAVKN